MHDEFLKRLSARHGHFRYESGYHGNLWLDLDPLYVRPTALRPYIGDLAQKLAKHAVTAICGPLVGGAFVGQMLAAELDVEFYYTERFVSTDRDRLYSVEYRLPAGLRSLIRGKKVAIVDDVISAGSAVRGTLTDLQACGVGPIVFGALLVLGSAAPEYCAAQHIPLESVTSQPNPLWLPTECPLCREGVPLEDPTS